MLFILQPTSYVGIISFSGATAHFQYTRLLQAVNISDQSPYVPIYRLQGQNALMRFFQMNGYFTATAGPTIERDDAHRIVNLIFTVRLGELARVGDLEFQGLSPEQSDRARKDLRSCWARLKRDSLKTGSKYSQQRIEKAVNYIRGELRNQGKLAPVVRLKRL